MKQRDRIGNILGRIQITGGEPTLAENLNEVVNCIRQYFPDRFIGINSNGYNLCKLIEVSNEESLKEFISTVGEDKVHFSCNLIKGYIDSLSEIEKYITWVHLLVVMI